MITKLFAPVVLGISLFYITPVSVAADACCKDECPAVGNLTIAEQLQRCAVTVKTDSSSGSGWVIVRNGTAYVITAAHVLEDARKVRETIDPKTGSKRFVISFPHVHVIQKRVQDGREVRKVELDAEVIRYSNADHGEDIAVLRVLDTETFKDSMTVYLDKKLPPVGSPLYHIGSPLGEFGSNSLTDGILSQHGRLITDKVFDQVTCPAFGGSSGGAVTLKDGRVVGMVVRGKDGGFTLIVPVRRLANYMERVGCLWLLDPAVSPPKDFDKVPIEEMDR